MSTAIEVEDLTKKYGSLTALDDLSLSVPQGTVFGLLGPNGAGKSTTVKVLTTLVVPDSGTASVDGVDVIANPAEVRRRIGTVTQQISVDRTATGRENLHLQGILYGLSGKKLRSRIDELLAKFHLDEAADKQARTYSGGMQRKLDVAMGLIHRPHVLFLDEPTTGLDPEARAELWEEIEQLRAEGMTMLLTTHYLEEADRLAANLAIVDHGRVVAYGTSDELKRGLHGDAVEVQPREHDDIARASEVLQALPEITSVRGVNNSLRARVPDGGAAAPRVLDALEAAQIPVASVTISRPSLDDVYLRYTGKTFKQAEEEAKYEPGDQDKQGDEEEK